MMPLSTDKSSMHTLINSLTAGGSTGGQIGVAWAWYLLSPNFGYLFPTQSQPATYDTPNTIKGGHLRDRRRVQQPLLQRRHFQGRDQRLG